LIACLLFLLKSAGGFDAVRETYQQARPGLARLFPPASPDGHWSAVAIVGYWDSFLVLVLGGIPWNCYFQRVLACRTPGRAASHSILAGGLTMLLVLPPLLLGVIAVKLFPTGTHPPQTLPLLLRVYVPFGVGLLGLAAIVGAVTSSYSSSILSAGSMFAWNVYRPLLAPRVSVAALKRVIRLSIVAVSLAAALLALSVGSVFDLWTFTADLVFVLLFPQLVYALFDAKVNRAGSVTAFGVSLVLRMGGGEPLFGVPSFIDYPSLFPEALVGNREMWYDPESGVLLFPYRTLAALAGLILLPLVSRLTSRWDSPRPLRAVPTHEPTSA
jgi:high affinity choline transporter 7